MDHSGTTRICLTKSELGLALMRHYDMQPEDPASWLFIDAGKPYMNFEGLLQASKRFRGWARVVLVLRLLPRPVRDWVYLRVARNRYRLFGRGDMCALPDPGFQRRLIQ